ncbi:MAG: HEAT repeat domain-containing protein [Elusimicrobia bacterium]|nr:HEAT repeat domain-containing protein [Elusimicrobiota bacterium]
MLDSFLTLGVIASLALSGLLIYALIAGFFAGDLKAPAPQAQEPQPGSKVNEVPPLLDRILSEFYSLFPQKPAKPRATVSMPPLRGVPFQSPAEARSRSETERPDGPRERRWPAEAAPSGKGEQPPTPKFEPSPAAQPEPSPAAKPEQPPTPKFEPLPVSNVESPPPRQVVRPRPAAPDPAEAECIRKLDPLIATLESKSAGSGAKREARQAMADLLAGLSNGSRVRLYDFIANDEVRRHVLKTTAFQPEDLVRIFESAQDHVMQAAVLDRIAQTRGMPVEMLFDLMRRAVDPATQERLYDFIASRDPAYLEEGLLLEAFHCARSPGMRVRCALRLLAKPQAVPLEALVQVLEATLNSDMAAPCFGAIVERDPRFFSVERLSSFLKAPASAALRARALQHLTEFHGKGLSDCPADKLAAMVENLAEDLSVRCLALSRLGKSKDPGAIGFMGRIASESRETALVRSAALALGDFGTPEACKVLLDLFASREPGRVAAAAEGLARTTSEAALDRLCAVLASDEARSASERLVRVVASIERNRKAAGMELRAKKTLLDLLSRNLTGSVGGDAASALGDLGVVEALPLLLKALESPDESLRTKAVTALGRLGVRDADVIRRLKQEWQEGPSFEVRRAAEAALKALQTGH